MIDKVASVYPPLPEQAEVDEFEPLLDGPATPLSLLAHSTCLRGDGWVYFIDGSRFAIHRFCTLIGSRCQVGELAFLPALPWCLLNNRTCLAGCANIIVILRHA